MNYSLNTNRIEKIFPDYFHKFELPESAKPEKIKVYRACRSGKCDKASFLPSYEEHNYQLDPFLAPDDPSQYSLSTYEKPNHIKRFASMNSDMHVPYKIAIGVTDPEYGVVQRTSERKRKAGSHVDWWLYEKATPYEAFELIPDFEAHLQEYKRRREEENA